LELDGIERLGERGASGNFFFFGGKMVEFSEFWGKM